MATLLVVALVALAIDESSPQSQPRGQPQALCEWRSRDDFARAQLESTFAIYCPTFLPEGFRLERFHFGAEKFPPDVTPPPEANSLYVLYVNPSTGARLTLGQGNLGTDLFPNWRLFFPPPEDWPILYGGDVDARAYAGYTIPSEGEQPAVVWGSEDGHQHVIMGQGVDAETLQTIAEGMLRLAPLNHGQSASR